MSFWNFPVVQEHDAAPLFRLMAEFDKPTAPRSRPSGRRCKPYAAQPRFDISETKEDYQLHGELPGIDQKDVEITFTDSNTIKISGRSERIVVKTSSSPSEEVTETSTENKDDQIADDYESISSKQPSVEDEEPETPATVTDEKQSEQKQETAPEPSQPEPKYWVRERSVGEFNRSFAFSSRVDTDRVKASMKNGILSIVVPKLVEKQSRRVLIE